MKVRAALLLAATLTATGCFSVQTIDVRDALLRRTPITSNATAEKLDRELTVYVVTSESLGGVIAVTQDLDQAGELGSYRAELFPLHDGDPDAQIEAHAKTKGGKSVLCGLRVEGFSEVLAKLLKERLGERFKTVVIETVRSLSASDGVAVTAKTEAYMEVVPTLEKRSVVRLRAESGERTIYATGRGAAHANRGHLIWAVPATFVAVTTVGLPGLVAIHLGLHSLEADALEDSLVEGIDDAAKQLSQRLSAEPERPVPLDLGGKLSP
jgi:hypothetical protein